jgi:3-deoxy-D-manno-octulosonic acid kinase
VRLFSAAYWRREGRITATVEGRGASWVVHRNGVDWVLRHYKRSGHIQFLDDRFAWLGMTRRTRPWREWQYLDQMRARNLPVPRPVATRIYVSGLVYRGDLITERIPDAEPLSVWLRAGDSATPPWHEIGRTLARFHACGAAHLDLNAHNVLIQPDSTVYLIDFDNARWRPAGGKWIETNLARLKRSLFRLTEGAEAEAIASQHWPALLAGYGGNPPPAPPSGLRPQRGG